MTTDKTKKETDEFHMRQIDKLDQIEMARIYRFAPSGHPYFSGNDVLYKYFSERFKSLGGMTSDISKAIGWRM